MSDSIEQKVRECVERAKWAYSRAIWDKKPGEKPGGSSTDFIVKTLLSEFDITLKGK